MVFIYEVLLCPLNCLVNLCVEGIKSDPIVLGVEDMLEVWLGELYFIYIMHRYKVSSFDLCGLGLLVGHAKLCQRALIYVVQN